MSGALSCHSACTPASVDPVTSRVGTMGRLKRNKTYRKYLQFYELNFQIRKPYRVLLDGNFMHTAVINGVLVRDKVPSLLGDTNADLQVPTAVVGELEKVGEPVAAALALALTFKRLKHGGDTNAADAIKTLVGTRNKNKYIVCTQDASLRDELAKVPGVPLVYLNHCALVLEPPSRASLGAHRKSEAKKIIPTRDERRRLQVPGGVSKATSARKPKPRREGPKGPNPLSVKKRIRSETADDGGGGTRRRKKRARS